MSSVTVIYNPESGSAIGVEELREAFDEHGDGHDIRWSPTTEDDPGPGQAREAIDSGSDTVIACGGDGTVRAIAETIAGSSVQLGVIPLGTGNLLAGNLDIPIGLAAVPVALSADAETLDLGVVNDEKFAVMAGVGFDAAMIRDANSNVKSRFGSLAYVISAGRNLPARIVKATVRIDGEEVWSGRTAMVLVGNCGSVTGGLEVFPDASPTDGILDVAVLTAEKAKDWAGLLWRLVRNKPQPPELVKRFTGMTIEVDLDRPVPYELDGEDRDEVHHLSFSIEPGVLKVRC
ncbi:MAG: diacylglycerol kinase family protein [Ilumatobacter sp.]